MAFHWMLLAVHRVAHVVAHQRRIKLGQRHEPGEGDHLPGCGLGQRDGAVDLLVADDDVGLGEDQNLGVGPFNGAVVGAAAVELGIALATVVDHQDLAVVLRPVFSDPDQIGVAQRVEPPVAKRNDDGGLHRDSRVFRF